MASMPKGSSHVGPLVHHDTHLPGLREPNPATARRHRWPDPGHLPSSGRPLPPEGLSHLRLERKGTVSPASPIG